MHQALHHGPREDVDTPPEPEIDLAAMEAEEVDAILDPYAVYAKGEAVLIDAWDRPEGYFYDITRSTFFGDPTDEYKKIWSVVLDAQTAGIEKAAPGVPCSEVDAAARAVIERAGYGEAFTHRLGHGLGIDVHEPPYMVGHDRTILEPGMTFTSEPGIYLLGRFGVRIEDDILVTERGAESLSPRVSRLEPIPA